MAIRINNSLTKKKEDFVPLDPKEVVMYSCGVTVYDRCHLGHARSLYIFDVIRRHLKGRGFKVRFIRNITDIDDKIINRAVETGRRWDEVVRENVEAYWQDLESLGITDADEEPRATENIPAMVKHIQGLIGKGIAYESGGNVYFSVRKFAEYGKLSGQSIEKMLEAVRIEKDEHKKDPLDFVLWKRSGDADTKAGWDRESLWGVGRPGWHIECSAMSMKYAGRPTLDIHAGGRDLIFPHHENEIAQSEALTDKPFAKYWIHHGLLTIDGQKMAKSLGNFITVEDALRQYDAGDLKMLFLSTHYSSTLDFSNDKMVEANKALKTFKRYLADAGQLKRGGPKADNGPAVAYRKAFEEAMDDDFNTPRALGVLHELVNETNRKKGTSEYEGMLTAGAAFVRDVMEKVFGITNFYDAVGEMEKAHDAQEVKGLLQKREDARARKDFAEADRIRDEILARGYIIEDTAQGARVIRK